MKDLFDLTGRVSVITGSTKGIGKAMAEALAAFGSKVVISSRKADACDSVAASINESGGEAMAHPCHVGHKDQLERLVAATRERWGKIDNLVVNAAVNPYFGSSLGIPDSAFDKVMEVNIKSVHWLCQMVIPEMQERKDGSIVIVSSVGGFRGNSMLGAYAISKAADMQLARNLAAEFGPDNVRVNAVCPGLVKTNFARALWEDPQREQAVAGRTPLRRLGEPVDCAGIAVYLASRAGSWTTGQTFTVDGGVLGCG
jgi:NAD(P)-dependent dehydrogenase (short-subunit alcohol dehydrogenase family)